MLTEPKIQNSCKNSLNILILSTLYFWLVLFHFVWLSHNRSSDYSPTYLLSHLFPCHLPLGLFVLKDWHCIINLCYIHQKIQNSFSCWATAIKFHGIFNISFIQVLTRNQLCWLIIVLKISHRVNTVKVFLLFFLTFTFCNCIVPIGFLLWEIQVAFPWESQLWQGSATQS